MATIVVVAMSSMGDTDVTSTIASAVSYMGATAMSNKSMLYVMTSTETLATTMSSMATTMATVTVAMATADVTSVTSVTSKICLTLRSKNS